MTISRALGKIRNQWIYEQSDAGMSREEIARTLPFEFGDISPAAVDSVLLRQEKRTGHKFAGKMIHTKYHAEPVHDAGPVGKYPRGFCLMCKAGEYQDSNWPNGICPACNGTGTYIDEILHRREIGGQVERDSN